MTALVNSAGTVLERYLYDPYGNVTVMDGSWGGRSGSLYDATILFAGYWRDAETGLYHVRNRMYHVRLGLWLQRDPEGYVDGMSIYEYVCGCPASHCDPQGTLTDSITASTAVATARVTAARVALEAAQKAGNPNLIRQAAQRLQTAVQQLNGFVDLLSKNRLGDPQRLCQIAQDSQKMVERANASMSYFQRAMQLGEKMFPADRQQAIAAGIKNLEKQIGGMQKVIAQHLQKLAHNPAARSANHWRREILVHQENIDRLKMAIRTAKKQD